MKNLRLKIWSLLIACATAYFVNSQTNSSLVTLVAPVELQNLPRDKVIIEPELLEAQVKLRGPSHLLAGLYSNPLRFRLRYDESSRNRFSVQLQEGQLTIPSSIEVLSIEPGQMDFSLDTLISRDIPVVVPRIGEPPNGYRVHQLLIFPGTVKVQGPESKMKDLRVVETLPLDLRETTEDRQGNLLLRISDKLIRLTLPSVQYQLDIESTSAEKQSASHPEEKNDKAKNLK